MMGTVAQIVLLLTMVVLVWLIFSGRGGCARNCNQGRKCNCRGKK